MSLLSSHASTHGSRGRRLAVAAALVASVAVVQSGPVSASGDGSGHVVVVDEGDSIQEAIDAAEPGTTIKVRGDHAEQLAISTDGIKLVGQHASITMPAEPDFEGPCGPTLICVFSPTGDFEDPLNPDNKVHDVQIKGFTLSNPFFDSIGTYFTHGLSIERNNVTTSDCSAIWLLFADDFEVARNDVANSVNCDGIGIAASNDGTVSRNTTTNSGFSGISLDDVSNVKIDRNRASGNCIGIVVSDSPGPLSSDNVEVTRNRANGNNTVCFPFGPPEFGGIPVGVAGILVAGPSHVTVSQNTASDNVTELETVTPGGIVITDFPNFEGDPNLSGDVLVKQNKVTGNSTAAGPLDINVNTAGGPVTVSNNRCGEAVGPTGPEPGWCRRH